MPTADPQVQEGTVTVDRELVVNTLAKMQAAGDALAELAAKDQEFTRLYGDQAMIRYLAWLIERSPVEQEKLVGRLYDAMDELFVAAFDEKPWETDEWVRHPLFVEIDARAKELNGNALEAKQVREAGTIERTDRKAAA